MSPRIGWSVALVVLSLFLWGCPETTGGPDAGETPDAGQVPDAGETPDAGPLSWHWENPLPSGWSVQALWGADADDVWAVGTYGNVLHWDGHRWTERYIGNTRDYRAAWGSASDDVWIVGEDPTGVLHWNGESFERVSHGGNLPLRAIHGSAANDVWAVGGRYWSGQTRGVIMYYDGTAWGVVKDDFAVTLTAVWTGGGDDVFVAGENGLVFRRDGDGWTPVIGLSGTTRAIGGLVAPNNPVFLTENGLYRLDRGVWTFAELQPFTNANALWFRDWSNIYVSTGGVIHRFDGDAWTSDFALVDEGQSAVQALFGVGGQVFAGGSGTGGWDSAGLWRKDLEGWHGYGYTVTDKEFRDVAVVSPTRIFAVGDDGIIAFLHESGNWLPDGVGFSSTLRGVWADADTVVVTSEEGKLWVRHDGKGWTDYAPAGVTARLAKPRGPTADNLWMIGIDYNNPTLFHFDGSNLMPAGLPAGLALAIDLWVAPDGNTLLLAGRATDNSAGFWIRDPDDGSWTPQVAEGATWFRGVTAVAPDEAWLVDEQAVYQWDGTTLAKVWECPQTGYFTGIHAVSATDVWAVGYDSVIAHFDGTAWEVVQDRASGWELFAVHASGPDNVVVVGESGTILRYGPAAGR